MQGSRRFLAAPMMAQPKKYGYLYIVCANLQFIGVNNVISICHVMHTTWFNANKINFIQNHKSRAKSTFSDL